MSDLISRSAIIKDIKECYTDEFLAEYGFNKLVEAQPTVEERPSGEWIEFDAEANEWSCSKCGHIWQLNDGTPEENCMNFCTKCGADMRGGKNE